MSGAPYIPGFWMNETSGVLRPAVEAYLLGRAMDDRQIATMRVYLCQWIAAPGFQGPEVDALRRDVDGIRTRTELERWLDRADSVGIDPL